MECLTDLPHPVSSIHSYYTHKSWHDTLLVKWVHTTQYGIHSLCYNGTNLWNSISIDVISIKKIKPFYSLMIDVYTVIIC